MEGFIGFVYFIVVVWGILSIVLFFKIWSMTNDIKELRNFVFNNNRSVTNEVEQFKNYFIDYMTRYEKEGSIVYGNNDDHQKYSVVRVQSDGKLLLDDNPMKSNIVELSIQEVIKKGDEVYNREYGKGRKKYIVVQVLSNGMLDLRDTDSWKEVQLSVDEVYKY